MKVIHNCVTNNRILSLSINSEKIMSESFFINEKAEGQRKILIFTKGSF